MSTLHALFIGIDDYFPNRLPDGSRYPSLHGATRDVARMALLLRDREGLETGTTRMLLSWAGEDGAPAELPERRPTYANLVAAFHQLALEARPGDRVYIHYSGHGSRVPTEYPGVKGPTGLDEALVPCDIGEPGSRYLRDLELAALLRLLVDRDLLVTVVLDCCHAGGALRGVAVPRRVPWVRLEPVPSAVGDPQTLSDIWRHLRGERRTLRGLEVQTWLPVACSALFAACRPDELAFEYPFQPGEPQGALTYWLLDTLNGSAGGLSHGEIHQRLVARIRGFFASQTPLFLGGAQHGFLSSDRNPVTRENPLGSLRVLRVADDGRVLVDAGVPAGVRAGDRVLLKDRSTGGIATELAIRQVGATESWAEVIRASGLDAIEPGMQAEVLRLRIAVRLIAPERGDREAQQALDSLREALRKDPDGFVEVCQEDGVPELCVVAERGLYEIQDPAGLPFRNLDPLPVDAPEAVKEVIRRLDHLAKFRNILIVENPRPAPWLGIGLEVLEDGPNGARTNLQSGGALDLRVGERLSLRIVNRSTQRLDFTVLDLAPDYSVTQILPARGGFCLLALDPGQAEEVHLKGFLPAGYNEGNDVLKVFATVGAANFQWLELRALGRPGAPLHPRIDPPNLLEDLFARLAAIRPAQRSGLVPSQFPAREWITAQMEIRVRR